MPHSERNISFLTAPTAFLDVFDTSLVITVNHVVDSRPPPGEIRPQCQEQSECLYRIEGTSEASAPADLSTLDGIAIVGPFGH